MAKTTKSKKGTAKKKAAAPEVIADFSKEEGGNRLGKVPPGDYKFKVVTCQKKESNNGNTMIVVDFEGTEGRVEGKQVRDYFVLIPTALFKLRSLLEAMGEDVPKKKLKLRTADWIGNEVGITLGDEEYEGKIRSKPQDYVPADDVDEEDDDDADDDEDEEDDDEDVEDLDLEDDDDL